MYQKSLALAILGLILCASTVQAQDWPMFHNNPQHTGFSDAASDMYIFNIDVLAEINISGNIVSAPVVADLDGDGEAEILYASTDQNLYAAQGMGLLSWVFQADSPPGSSPAVGDLNGDGEVEIGFASSRGVIYLLDAKGNKLWEVPTSEEIISAPAAIADYDNDGEQELFVGSYMLNYAGELERFDYQSLTDQGYSSIQPQANSIYADLDRDGSVEEVLGTKYVIPAVANFDEDPDLEVVGVDARLGDVFSEMQLRKADGRVIWESDLTPQASPSLADLEGDGTPEIIFSTTNNSLVILDAKGEVLWEKNPAEEFRGTPVAIADIDGDGSLELVFGSRDKVFIYGEHRDSDGDGLLDYEERITGTDPNEMDTDHDGIIDSLDDTPLEMNLDNIDSDSDGLSDAAEIRMGTDPYNEDTDGDGILDRMDDDPLVQANILQKHYVLLLYLAMSVGAAGGLAMVNRFKGGSKQTVEKKRKVKIVDPWRKRREQKMAMEAEDKFRLQMEKKWDAVLREQFFITDEKSIKDLLKLIIEKKRISSRDACKEIRVSQIRLAKSANELIERGLITMGGSNTSNPVLIATPKLLKALQKKKK